MYLSTSESFDVTKLKSLSYGLSNNASYGMTLVADMTTLNEAIASIVYLPRNDYIGKAFVQITLMENTQIVNSASSAFGLKDRVEHVSSKVIDIFVSPDEAGSLLRVSPSFTVEAGRVLSVLGVHTHFSHLSASTR